MVLTTATREAAGTRARGRADLASPVGRPGGPTYATSLLAAVGVANVLADRGAYPRVDLAAMAEARPDVVLAPSEPYPFAERHRRELETVAPVVLVDGRDLFWWGSRTPGATARLGEAVARWAAIATRA